MLFLGFLLLAAGQNGGAAHAAAVLYPAPAGAVLSADYAVKVNGQAISVYRGTKTGQNYSFAYFDFSGTVSVEVTIASPYMKTPIIRPTSKSIAWTLNNKTMLFSLSSPSNISIEPDSAGIIDATPLLLFANPLEVNPPTSSGPGVMYYGPGIHTLPVGGMTVPSGTTLYIAGGAIVQGRLIPSGSNITIRGRGILDNQGVYGSVTNQPMLNPKSCTNLSIEGIILKDSGSWTVQIVESSYVTINNLKIVSAVGPYGHDGIHVVNSNHVTVQDSFIHSDDDNIGISGFSWGHNAPVDAITVTRCVFWAQTSNNWRIGWMGYASYMSNLTFTDIDILHRTSYNRVVALQPSGNGTTGTPVTNVRFENIRIDADYGWTGDFIQMTPGDSIGLDGAVGPPGSIQNVYLKNITLSGYRNPATQGTIEVVGPSASSYVRDVTFENVVRYGQPTSASSANVLVGSNASNIVFLGGGAPPPPDTAAPSVPAGVSAQAVSSSQINLTWSASSDNVGVSGYKIFRGGTQVATSPGTSYADAGLSASTAYSYTVAAYDAAGNTSAQSSAASVMTQAAPPPGFPVDLQGAALPESGSVVVSVSKPANAVDATITLAAFDADNPDEGTLTVNGACPTTLFGAQGVGPDSQVISVAYTVPASCFSNGSNTLLFTHTNTMGYRIDSAQVSFSGSTPAPTCPGPGSGAFSACYFNNMTLDAAGLALTRSEGAVNFDWGAGAPDASVNADNFSARWQGNFAFNAGDYTFSMTVDDGGRLSVDGILVIDQWINQAATTYTVTRAMTAGTHLIKMEYYENGGGATAKLSWSQAGAPSIVTDLNGDGVSNVADVQLGVNQALGLSACASGDVNRDGACNITDVQKIVNAVLGL